jgi:hypothetical protein
MQRFIEVIRSATAFFDKEIAALELQRVKLIGRRDALTERKCQLSLVLSELDGEEQILTANVQETDLLRQFCGPTRLPDVFNFRTILWPLVVVLEGPD